LEDKAVFELMKFCSLARHEQCTELSRIIRQDSGLYEMIADQEILCFRLTEAKRKAEMDERRALGDR